MTTTTPYANSPERSPGTSFAPNVVDWIALVLTIIGGINWGLVGAFEFDLVARLLGEMTTASRIVYVLVGIAAVYCVTLLARFPRRTA